MLLISRSMDLWKICIKNKQFANEILRSLGGVTSRDRIKSEEIKEDMESRRNYS